MTTIEQLIQHYDLLPHPEGGWYKETYRSEGAVASNALPASFSGDRAFCTAIYFLLDRGNFSAFHRIKSDECWHFYTGGALEIFVIHPEGKLEIIRLGSDTACGEIFQYVVPAHCWFASRPAAGTAFSLVGCTVSPGFDFEDFELANAAALVKTYPQHEVLIKELCR
ncbi:cupin domain-containing protein [Ferruginibacter sp.]